MNIFYEETYRDCTIKMLQDELDNDNGPRSQSNRTHEQ